MSFRETREMLLLAYDGKMISNEAFLVLWESCRFKNPYFPQSLLQDLILKTLTKQNVWQSLESRNTVIPVLANVLQLPVNIRCQHRTICDTIEGLCMLLRMFSYPCHYSDMISRFGRPVPDAWLRKKSWTTFSMNEKMNVNSWQSWKASVFAKRPS